MTNTPDKSEMLPCPLPWCDESKPVLAQGGFRNATYRVQCETCGCAGPRFYEPNKAIAAWNIRSRPPADQVPELVEELRFARNVIVGGMHNCQLRTDAIERLDAALQAVPAALRAREEDRG